MVTVPRFEEIAGQVVPEPYHDRLGAALVVVAGLASSLFHARELLEGTSSLIALVFGVFVPLVLSGVLLVGGVWLSRGEYDGLGLRVGTWCLIWAGLMTGVSIMVIQYQASYGVRLRNAVVVVSATATGGAVIGLLIGIYDAERRRSERRMAAEREKAERLGRRLSVLNRVLRHDIRNDVNVIHGNADRIINGSGAETPARTIKEKATKLHRLSESARQIETLLEREGAPVEPVDLVDLLSEERRRLTSNPGVAVEADLPEKARASASPMIDSAVWNIVENAIEHSDRETPRVEIGAEVGSEWVEIRITDDGPGIPDSEVRVLERGHETDLDHGSGLGLWLTNWIVTESGGKIRFEENEPRGSVVTIRLPRADPVDVGSERALRPGTSAG